MEFSFAPILGGILIGLSATILLLFNGKVAGISGIYGGLLSNKYSSSGALFVTGLILSGIFVSFGSLDLGSGEPFENTVPRGLWTTALAGILVGFGTTWGNGCTSGHGICGLGRGSKRSFVATLTFMSSGLMAAYVTQHLIFSLVID